MNKTEFKSAWQLCRSCKLGTLNFTHTGEVARMVMKMYDTRKAVRQRTIVLSKSGIIYRQSRDFDKPGQYLSFNRFVKSNESYRNQ